MTTLGLDPALLDIIVCPACHGSLVPREAQTFAGADAGEPAPTGELACSECGLVYPVRDGIPVLLVDEARPTAQ